MKRRDFISKSLLVGGSTLSGITLANSASARAPANSLVEPSEIKRIPGSDFKLSLAAYSFRASLPRGAKNKDTKMTLGNVIDFCAQQNLDGVELTSYFFHRTDNEYLAQLKRKAFLNGLAITGTPVGNNFCFPKGKKRSEQIQHVKKWVDYAAFLGAPCIRIFAGNTPKGATEAQAVAWCIEGLKEACNYAGEKGIVLALENHGGITSTAKQLRHLVESTDSPWIGINLDTGNFRKNAYREIEAVADLAVVVQHKVEIHDDEGKKVPSNAHRIVKILDKAQYRGVIALEYEAKGDPFVEIPKHLDDLRSAITLVKTL